MKMNHLENTRFIFLENSGKRWKYSKVMLSLLSLMAVVFMAFIVKGLINSPLLTNLEIQNGSMEPINNPVTNPVPNGETKSSMDAIHVTGRETKPKVFVFYQPEHFANKENLLSLQENLHTIDVFIPDWLYLNEEGAIEERADSEIDSLVRESGTQIIPSITLDEESTADDLHNWLTNPQTQSRIIENLQKLAQTREYHGIHLNFDDIHWEDKELYEQFVTDLYHAFHQSGLLLTVFARLRDDTYDTKLLADVADHIMVQAFDQHIENGEAGPLASFQWTEETINLYGGPMQKLVPILANYAYNWNLTTGKPAHSYDFSSLMEMVNREKLKIQWHEGFLTPYVRYIEQQEEHVMWLLDGATFYNQLKIAQSHDIPGIGVWNIGSEDPSIWKLLTDNIADPTSLETMSNRVSSATAGEGDFLKVTQVETEGKRVIKLEHHFIEKETYEPYPTPYLLEKYGSEEKKVAISFDDGPNPNYTGRILDILEQHDVKAAFFLIGQNASMHSDLTKRIYEEGHEIGSHTFTHREVMSISELELVFELNATQRVIQGITEHSVILFRPPFLLLESEDELPSEKVFDRFLKMQEMGYTVVSSTIDPKDWSGKSAEEIFADTIKNVQNGRIILLHDSGGNRNPTVEALPKIIEWLKVNGYAIVPVSELVGKERDVVMPAIQQTEKAMMPWFSYGTSFHATLIKSAKTFLSLLIVIGLFRLALLLFFSLKQKSKSKQLIFDDSYTPFVTVLIAAYNEEKVIENTIHAILNSRYSHFELIIVDDGSKDQTASIVEASCQKHANIRLIRKENGGKASALNLGIQFAAAEILVTLDADTLIAENTIPIIIRQMTDTKIGAISGNVKIGNRNNLLTWWQHIEYVTGYNLDKRAFDELGSITVVPGAIGAWRKSALVEAGLFEEDTLAEDTDITMKLLRKGYKIKSEVDAIAYTEAPEDLRSFIKQRYRWTFGILQCIWKHRQALFNRENKRLGFIAMPNMIFQYVLLASAPLADFIFILALVSGNTFVAYFYLVFLLADTLVSVYAFALEKEKKMPLWTLFVQRIVYRQFFTFVVWKTFIYAVKGQLQGWNKLQRTGNATQTDSGDIQKSKAGLGS